MINERLKNLRLAKGLTLQQVGDAFGISRASVSSWESGTNQPDPRKLEKLAELLDTSVHYLVTGANHGLNEQLYPHLKNCLVPFVPWSNLTKSKQTLQPISWVQCLYVSPSNSAFATRYQASESFEWQPYFIPAGAMLVVDPSNEPSPGKLVLVSRDDHVEMAQIYNFKDKSELGLQFVNSKLTAIFDKSIDFIGVIQEWRVGGKV